MSAIIICNGSIIDYSYYKKYFRNAPFIICADGGARHLKMLGVKPDILLGDFDSISNEDLDYYKSLGVELLKYPPEKDMTDTDIAVSTAVDLGYKDIIIIGGMGTRFDHSLANVFLLKGMLDIGIRGCVINEYNEIYLIDDKIKIDSEIGFKLSLIPISETVEGITSTGLYYQLNEDTIKMGESRGVSNEFAADTSEISIKSGLLLVIKSKD